MRCLAQSAGRASTPHRGCAAWALYFVALGSAAAVSAQQPIDPSHPVVVKEKKLKTQYAVFEGTVMHANNAQITVRSKDNELAIRTFSLSRKAADEMQKIIDRGGYQYGDRVKVWYVPATEQAVKVKGKPSRPI